MELNLVDGSEPGYLLLKLNCLTSTIQNFIRYAADKHLVENQWHVAGGREREPGPFDSGTKAFVKAAALSGFTTSPQHSGIKSRHRAVGRQSY